MTATPTLTFGGGEAGGVQVDLPTLLAGRLLIQGSSGAGKSYLTRYMLEQTHGHVQQFIFDPEGEFATLREHYDYLLASAGGDGDVPADPKSARLLCRRVVELGVSVILDLYELDPEDREEFVGEFLRELINLPKELWTPRLVVIDEAHEFAPEGAPKGHQALRQMRMLTSKGRKRGLGGVYLTQRVSKLHKDVAEAQNVLIGYTGLDVDVKRAGDVLGFDKAGREGLKRLEKGEFYAFGPAISKEVVRVRSGPVQTTHPEVGEIAPPAPPAPAAIRDLIEQLQDLPERAAEEERTVEALEERVRELGKELRRARQEQPAPDPATIEREIASAVEVKTAKIRGEAVALQHKLARVEAIAKQLVQAAHVNGDAPSLATRPAGATATAATPRPAPAAPPRARTRADSDTDLKGPERKVLEALARYESFGVTTVERAGLAALAGYTQGGHFNNTVSGLNSRGLVEYPRGGAVTLTPAGRGLVDVAPLTSLREVHDAWLGLMDGPQQKVMTALLEAHPVALAREHLAALTGYEVGGHFNNVVSGLKTLGAAEYPQRGHVRATDLLFPEGLR